MKRNATTDLCVIANNIEKTLASLDDIGRAKARPFLYLRIQGRLNSRQFSSKKYSFLDKMGFFFSRPAVAISFLLLIVFIDGLAILSTLTILPAQSENPREEFFKSDNDLDETLFYITPENEGTSIY